MAAIPILPHSALAAVNTETQIRLYFQQPNGQLSESYTNAEGTRFFHVQIPLPALEVPKLFTPLAACTFNCGKEVRLYYLNKDNHVCELCWSRKGQGGSWYPGELNKRKAQAAPYSKIAVVAAPGKLMVFYQRSLDNKIIQIEYTSDRGWVFILPNIAASPALPGTGITAIQLPDRLLRLYYQDSISDTISVMNGGGPPYDPIPHAKTAPHSSLVILNAGDTGVNLRLYTETTRGEFGELMNNGGHSDTWSLLKVLGGCLPMSALAAVTWPREDGKDAKWIRVYTQEAGGEIEEWIWGAGGGWRKGIPVVIS